jgi:hypothetical protein
VQHSNVGEGSGQYEFNSNKGDRAPSACTLKLSLSGAGVDTFSIIVRSTDNFWVRERERDRANTAFIAAPGAVTPTWIMHTRKIGATFRAANVGTIPKQVASRL